MVRNKEYKVIILNDGNIVSLEKPKKYLPPGVFYRVLPFQLDGSTRIVKSLGYESFIKETDKYFVQASAQKYLADIAKYQGILLGKDQKLTNCVEKQVLFSGAIQVYTNGYIEGSEVKGDQLIENGDIWFSKNPTSKIMVEGGLEFAIFGRNISPNGTNKIIEQILNGYESQRINEKNAISSENLRNFKQGQNSRERIFG